jgi:uncharacterized protein (DUF924 family)
MSSPDTDAAAVVSFWMDAGADRWFRKDAEFDARFRERFLALHEQAAAGALDAWGDTADGTLALLILLDQFPRNAFRGSARMFATDAQARRIAYAGLARGFDARVLPPMRPFMVLPLTHSEDAQDQARAVEKTVAIGGETHRFALLHQDIIRRFGRFPHRNPLLGRSSTAEELRFLAEGGFAG